MSIQAMKQALEALKIGQDAFSQAFSGYGYYRPDNPHNFFPDPECCTPKEIAYHSAACEAYDKGTYVPDHSDGWITPELHVTKAPWGIGTYTDECKEITDAITALRAAITEAERQEPAVRYFEQYQGQPIEEIWEARYNATPEDCRFKLYTTPQPAIPEWQPIETPPKEWGSYLIWHPKYGMETLWFQLKDGGNDGRKAGNWYDEEGDDDYPCNARVTHWMPLPAAPKPENSHE